MKIRLRYELWEHHDGLSFRRASRVANARDRNFPEGRLRQVFYASSEADATAQYLDLRGIRPAAASETDSHAPFTRAELEAQFAEFPDDPALAAQMEPQLSRDDIPSAAPVASPGYPHSSHEPRAPQPALMASVPKRDRSGGGAMVRTVLGFVMVCVVLGALAVFLWPELGRSIKKDGGLALKAVERVVSEP